MILSFTEENYLKAIYKLTQHGGNTVNTNAIAAKIKTKAASVTDMLKKLSDKKLINYQKYQGVSLSPTGKKVAVKVIRKHRLWEVFLVEKLAFKWDEVHDMAEQLEHIQSDELIQRLDKFLGFPSKDPHGDPIPDAKGNFKAETSLILSALKENESGIMTGVVDHRSVFLQYLDKIQLTLGCNIQVKQVNPFDQSMSVQINRKEIIQLSREAAENILIQPQK
jgi:DtxR family transcriptional regulator, Mn-dependent transcriptional regulator